MDLNESLKGWLQQQAQPGSFLDKAGLGLAKAGQTIGRDAAAGAAIMNDPRNSWIGMNPLGKAAIGGLGLVGMLGKHEVPGLLGAVEKTAAKNYKNWFEQVGIKAQQEAEGQGILDDLVEMGRSPKQVHDDFFTHTYPQLPDEAKDRFHQYIQRLTSFKPGSVYGVDKAGNELKVKDWSDILTDLPDQADGLEGTERGLFALMEMANQRFKPLAQGASGLVDDGKTLNLTPRATP